MSLAYDQGYDIGYKGCSGENPYRPAALSYAERESGYHDGSRDG